MMLRISALWIAILAFATLAPAAAPPGAGLLAQGRIDDAINAARARIDHNSSDAEAYNVLCRAFFHIQRWDDSISNGERAVALQPNNSDFHMWLGRAYGEKADASSFVTAAELAKKVRNEFEAALRLNANNSAVRADLAEYYAGAPGFLGGGKDKARALASQVESSDPGTAHWIRAMLAEKDKNYDMAEQEFKAAISTSNLPAKYWLRLASFYRKRSRPTDMEQAIISALNAPNPEVSTKFDAAEILLRGGRNFTGAVQLFKDYIDSSSHNEEAPLFQAHYLLGQLLEKLHQKDRAAEQYRAAIALASGYQRAQSALKRLQ